ncbi:cilia- and flagella-associated protein 58 [Marchantia polymorpha subsp. ruderalis]|uniref:Cilia- and flagella-associated protein 58 central coiled coil domain-containing protein n=2 Tax=Marchantia polymorpha TaxID=3197 RepID=A0AAF6BMH5_MARPO|nr:hypothetical protein MARPO_0052s0037 [Marchantia polymorpha]BBN13209.1 hypothetical protein Mp_6g01670 [Marchantia polymorpha subsp. ruderalis]|eukprot:PTQ38236.1 hypothetical protein MARPO_0052s0037 [Marchantia polymorpha]
MSRPEEAESGSKPSSQVSWMEKEKELTSGFELQAFETLEREFQQVLYELQTDPSLDKFRNEYEKLHRALKKSHESEKRLIKKCRELNSEIQTNTAKVQTALTNSEEDQLLILDLREEIGKAWKMVDATQEKEAKAKENIQALKQEIANLSGIVDQNVTFAVSKDTQVGSLEDEKLELVRERDRLLATSSELKKELAAWVSRVRILEEEKVTSENDLATVKGHLHAKRAECDRELRRKERLEKDVKELNHSIETNHERYKQKELELAQCLEQNAKTEALLEEEKHAVEKSSKLIDLLNTKIVKLQYDLEEQLRFNTQLLSENSERMVEMRMREDEITTVRDEVVKVRKLRDATMNKLKVTEAQKAEIEQQKEDLQGQISQLEKEKEIQRKLSESDKKRYEESIRERDVLTKMKAQAEDLSSKHADTLRLKETIIKNLELELQQYRDHAAAQDHAIEHLERERRKCAAEVSDATAKYMKVLDAMQAKELEILEGQKIVEAKDLEIKQQKALFEVVRTEKNIYSKRLVDTQDEINQAKRKLQISTQMVQALKDKLAAMDGRIEKGASEIIKVEKEKEVLNENLSQIQGKVKNAQAKIATYVSKIQTHDVLVNQANDETVRLKKEYTMVKTERDMLAAQLTRRDDELKEVYEKIRIQQSTLDKGRVQYLDRLDELRTLKLKLTDLKREQAILSGSLKSISILKREINGLNRELLREKLKVRIMTEELETPQNIHRWRTLESTDPTVYEMITKVQTLQKRLIVKTEEVTQA